MPKTSRLALIIVAILIFVSLAAFGGLFAVSPITGADTTTHTADYHTWRGDGRLGPIGGDGMRHEILDAPKYVGGFKADGFSEKMVAQGGISRFQASCVRPNTADYRWWFRSIGATYPPANTFTPSANVKGGDGKVVPTPSGFVLIKEDATRIGTGGGCPDFLTGSASLAEVKGNYIGIIRVEMWVDFQDINYEGYHLMATDEATVQPGWGLVSILNQDSLVQIDETLSIRYDVGAACADTTDPGRANAPCGWTVSVRNRETGDTPEGWTDKSPADYTSGTYSVVVKKSWFTIGRHNEYEVKLFNQVNLQDAKTFVTIDDRKLAPPVPTVTISPAPPYRQGQDITITAHSERNSITNAAIVDYHIIVRQGDRQLLDVRSADGNGTFSIADEQVDIQVEVTAFDGSRTSGVNRRLMVVLDSDLDNNPPGEFGKFPIWIIFIIAGAIAILIGVLVPLPAITWRIVAILIGAVIIVVGLFAAGVFRI